MRSQSSRAISYGMALLSGALIAGASSGRGTHGAPSALLAGEPPQVPLPAGGGPGGGPYGPRGGLPATVTPTPRALAFTGPNSGGGAGSATVAVYPPPGSSGTTQSVYGPTGPSVSPSDSQPLAGGL